MVLIRPTILKTPEDAALIVSKERLRLPGVREAEAEFKADNEARLKRVERKLSKRERGGFFERQPDRKLELPNRKTQSKPPFK